MLNLVSSCYQEHVLAGLLLDLSLLDQYMFKFRPGTLAAAALFLARVTAAYYSKVGFRFPVCGPPIACTSDACVPRRRCVLGVLRLCGRRTLVHGLCRGDTSPRPPVQPERRACLDELASATRSQGPSRKRAGKCEVFKCSLQHDSISNLFVSLPQKIF